MILQLKTFPLNMIRRINCPIRSCPRGKNEKGGEGGRKKNRDEDEYERARMNQ
jgi:hypothetical protein